MASYDIFKLITDYADLKITKRKFDSIISTEDYLDPKLNGYIKRAKERRQKTCEKRSLEVIYFTGKSGSGKTTAAKYFSEKLGFDYFVSGSGDDIMDGYDKEECVILDDFRAGTFKFAEFLKLIDNNTNSSVKSRYTNKDLSNCKLIIITSIKSPLELYPMLNEDNMEEPKEQLYRRLKHRYYNIDTEDGDIKEISLKQDSMDQPTGNILGNMDAIYKELGIDLSKADDSSLFDKFIKKSYEPIETFNNEFEF